MTCSATASRSRPSTSAPKPCRSSATATVEHNPAEEFALTADDPAYFYPFLYDDEEFPDLVQFITPQYGDPNGELSAWARNFLDARRADPDLQYSQRHDPRHPRGLHLSQAARARHPASARYAADRIRHLPRLCAVHDRGAAAARHRRALRVGLSVHPRRSRRMAMSAAARPMPGCRSICRARAGSSSIPPTASSAPAISFASRWRAIRARRSRCTAPISAPPTRSSAWRSASTSSPRETKERRA